MVVPQITKVSVTPTSAPAGTKFKFIATLNSPLNVGDKLKINVGGNSLVVMTGTGIQYSLSQAVFTAGKKAYTVGIYNNNGVLQGKVSNGTYMVTSVAPTNHAPTLTLIKAESSAITNTAYTVTLNAKDVDANLSSISMNWGDSSEPETANATDSKDLVFSHTYTSASSFGWNAFATDKGTPVLNSKSVSKIVAVSEPPPPPVVTAPAKITGYTKIANDGSELPDSATFPVFGVDEKDWACTRDNKTGLIWEIKTLYGLHALSKTYTNYTIDYPKCDGSWCSNSGYTGKYGDSTNADGFVTAVNKQGFCGASDWRMPTIHELEELVYCSDGKYNKSDNGDYSQITICKSNEFRLQTTLSSTITNPTINPTYFPNIVPAGYYWSSSPFYAGRSDFAAGVNFDYGSSGGGNKQASSFVMLVR